MNVIFTCGGTAGHVNPALALARYMLEKDSTTKVLFIGTPDGMERGLVEKAGFAFAPVPVGSFRRSLSFVGLRHNLTTVRLLRAADRAVKEIFRWFCPDLVVGTGGYASYPAVKAAAKKGIPTAVHESNMIPGLTTKMLEQHVDRVMVGFEDCRRHYKHPEKIAVTGTPVRGDLFSLERQEARAALGYTDGKPVVVSFWGSLGASTMNERMLDFFQKEKEAHFPFHHIHAAGSSGWATLQEAAQQRGLESEMLDLRQYIHNMDVVMAAADLVVARAGASTVSELTALGKASILVPSPFVVANHQEKNASLLHRHGGAVMLLESDASGEALYETASAILSDTQRRETMERAARELGIPDATARLYETVMALV